MKRIVPVAVLTLLCLGCTSILHAPSELDDAAKHFEALPDAGRVFVYMEGGTACDVSVGGYSTTIDFSTFASLRLEPGTYTLEISCGGTRRIIRLGHWRTSFEIKRGEAFYFRTYLGLLGSHFDRVSAELGQREVGDRRMAWSTQLREEDQRCNKRGELEPCDES